MDLVLAALAALVALTLAAVLIHNHKAVANASAELDALAIKVDPVIRAGEAQVKALDASIAAQVKADPTLTSPVAPAASVTGQLTPGVTADVAGSQTQVQ